ncbi:MAG: diaminopimelate epimerase [Bacteroidia bacterium]
MEISFHKYQGTGNDFILIDNRSKEVQLSTDQIRWLCNRHFGIGADGLMLLELEPGVDFKMVYFNSDGNESSMCGNGGRCICAFAHKLGLIENKAKFIAIDGIHEALITDEGVSLKMSDVKSIDKGENHFFLNTGSPHYVKFVYDVKNFNVYEEGKKVRNSDAFVAEGTNVNFIEKIDDALFVRTYERGVEDETLSCGTGVTASALVAAVSGVASGKNNCRVLTLGGSLNVKFDRVLESNFYNIWLEGPAEQVFEGKILLKE